MTTMSTMTDLETAETALQAAEKAHEKARKALEGATTNAAEALGTILSGVKYKTPEQILEAAERVHDIYLAAMDTYDNSYTVLMSAYDSLEAAQYPD